MRNTYIRNINYIRFSKAIFIAAQTSKMQSVITVIISFSLVANGAKLSIDNLLTNFEDRINSETVIDQFQTIDPATQAQIETQDLLSIQRKIRIYPAAGLLVSNNVLDLGVPSEKFNSLVTSIDKLVEVAPRDTYVKSLVKKKQKVERFYDSICNLSGSSQRQIAKRFIVTVFVATITALIVTVPTTVGVVAKLGAFEDSKLSKEEIDTGIENNSEKQDRDDFFNNKIESLRTETQSLEARLNIQDQAHTITRNLENMMDLLTTVLDPENYDFEDNFFLEKTLRSITSNEEFMSMLDGNKFGLNDQIAMLTLSEADSFVVTDSMKHKCARSFLVQKLKTVIPDDQYEAEATEDMFRYKLSEDRSLWINPALIMEPSKYRPQHTFSKQRSIVSANEKVASVLPYNNTVFFVQTDGNFEMTRTCGDVSKTFMLYKDPVFHLPLGCSLTSRYLNVSTFKILYNNKEIQSDEDFNIDTELFHPVYDVDTIHTEAYNMREKIHKIFTNSDRISHIELEKYQNRKTLEMVKDKVFSIFNSIKSFCKSVQDEFFLEPLYKILGIVLTGIVGLVILVVVMKLNCSKK